VHEVSQITLHKTFAHVQLYDLKPNVTLIYDVIAFVLLQTFFDKLPLFQGDLRRQNQSRARQQADEGSRVTPENEIVPDTPTSVHNQPTPDIAWIERETFPPQDRSSFAASVQQFETEERQQRQQQLLEEMPLGPKDIASCRRVAISRALVAHGLLSFRRKRITLPIKLVIWSNIR
jgi:hypothetical protein